MGTWSSIYKLCCALSRVLPIQKCLLIKMFRILFLWSCGNLFPATLKQKKGRTAWGHSLHGARHLHSREPGGADRAHKVRAIQLSLCSLKTVFLPTSLKWSETLTKKYLKSEVRKTKRGWVQIRWPTHTTACCGLQGSNPSVKKQSKMSLPASALAVAPLTQLQTYLWRLGEVMRNFCWTIALCVKGFREEGTSNKAHSLIDKADNRKRDLNKTGRESIKQPLRFVMI